MMDNLTKDFRFTLLMLRKNPGFAAAAVLSLMLAIGASSTIFSFVNAILLRAMPYKNPDQLVMLFETFRKEGVERRGLSYPDYVDWRDQNQVFEQIAAFASVSFTLSGDEPESIFGELVSASYFDVLGIKAVSGRTFLPEEDHTLDSHPVAVISHGLWQRRFGSTPNIAGKTLRLNDRNFSVIGVVPEGFYGLGGECQVWIPMMMISSARTTKTLEERYTRWHQAVARLKPGVSIERAQSDIDILARRLEQTYPNSNSNRGGLVVNLQEEIFGSINIALRLLMGAVGFVVLISCANLANLLLVRAVNRQRELALRVALGASRRRLIQQLLTESVLLALIGGMLGLALTALSLNVLKTYIPVDLPSFVNVNIDLKAFAFTFLISVITGLICGLIPALRASRQEPGDVLKESSRGIAGRGQRLRNVLVVAEASLTLVLMIGAGLVISSLKQMQKIDLGFKPENVMTIRLNLPEAKYSGEKVAAFAERLIQNAKSLPGVRAASIGSHSPLNDGYSATIISVEGDGGAGQGNDVRVYYHPVTSGFFSTIHAPLLKGRDFTNQDVASLPPVAIVSESMARRFWPSEEPVGKRIKLGRITSSGPWISIVGVAKDVKYRTLIESSDADPDVYFPLAQLPTQNLNLLVSTTTDPTTLIGPLRREILKIDPGLPAYDPATMTQRFDEQTAQSRFNVLLFSIFAVIALVLAAIGIYGVMSYTMAQRTREFGIRLALGAQARDILWIVLGQTVRLIVISLALGLTVAFSLSQVIGSVLYGVAATDPATFLFASAILVATTLLASFVPAFRAIIVNPMIALRQE